MTGTPREGRGFLQWSDVGEGKRLRGWGGIWKVGTGITPEIALPANSTPGPPRRQKRVTD